VKPEKAIVIVKDLVLFFGGLAGITYQTITGNVNLPLLIIFTAMAGVPGLTNISSLFRALSTQSRSYSEVHSLSESESERFSGIASTEKQVNP
jgi:hypothetical protein